MIRKICYLIVIVFILSSTLITSSILFQGNTSAKEFTFSFGIALLLVIRSFELLIRKESITFKIRFIDILIFIFYFYILIRTILVGKTPLLQNNTIIIITYLILFYYTIRRISKEILLILKDEGCVFNNKIIEIQKISVIEFIEFVLLIIGNIEAIWGILQLYNVIESNSTFYKVTGSFFNPAPYAIFLSVVFPISVKYVLLYRGYNNDTYLSKVDNAGITKGIFQTSKVPQSNKCVLVFALFPKVVYYSSILLILLTTIILPTTMNRASWISAFIGAVFIINQKFNIIKLFNSQIAKSSIKRIIIFLSILIIIFMILGLFYVKKDSSKGRMLIWEITIEKVFRKPIFGYGLGSFQEEYNNWQADFFRNDPNQINSPKSNLADNTFYCFNEYLELTVELGVVGLFLFSLIIYYIVFKPIVNTINRKTLKKTNEDLLLFSYGPLLSLLACAFISIPFYSLPSAIIFTLYLAQISSFNQEENNLNQFINLKILRIKVSKIALSIIILAISICIVKRTQRQYHAFRIWEDAYTLYQTSNYQEACYLYSGICSILRYNGQFNVFYSKALYQKKDYLKSLEILTKTKALFSDEILYTTLGDCYKEIGKYNEAEEAYRHAYFMVPHKLYSQYLLANLYLETNQNEKAISIAKELSQKKPKVESEAVNEMKQFFKKLLQDNDYLFNH